MTRPVFIPRSFSSARLSTIMKNTHSSPSSLAILSHHKLEQEASAEEPDLRRCLGHNSVLSNTMSATRRNSDRYRKSFRFCEDDMDSSNVKKEKEQDKGSHIRAQIAKTVKAMVKRRSVSPAPAPSLMVTSTNTNTTTNTTTTIPKDKELVRVPVIEHKSNRNTDDNRAVQNNNNQSKPSPTPTPPSGKSPLTTKSRKCMARLVTGRKFWMQSMMVQTSVG